VLSGYLKDPDPTVQIAAIRSVASIRDFSIFDHLVPMLSDPQPAVRRSALAAIEDRIGLRFSDFDANGSETARLRAIAKIKSTLPNFKQRFDNASKYEANKKK
jgi:HEAT repeat protein